jgi:hypothetical protein
MAMHGLINRSIQCFVTETYGEPAWTSVAREAGGEWTDFESLQVYDDAVTTALLSAAARVLDKSAGRVLEDIGTWLVTNRQPDTVRRLLRFGGVDFVDFLHSLEDLPGRVRLAVNDLELPTMEVMQHAPDCFTVTLGACALNYSPVLLGLVQAMADDYGALAVIEQAGNGGGPYVLTVRLFQTDYAQGRDFQLGAVAR